MVPYTVFFGAITLILVCDRREDGMKGGLHILGVRMCVRRIFNSYTDGGSKKRKSVGC